ncbi:Uncharacterized protein SCG7086_CM_00020 [Chlamydiales bacterium SCGC AG-110-P3]|nr:Uncharacterized protein SCG7086_CM_00020 [Chlamydiales bacterium SCGC AG-110-P3]
MGPVTFKRNWEKTDQRFQIDEQAIRSMIGLGTPSSQYRSHQVVSGGCANLNIKVQLEEQEAPVILRIYLRDHKAALREQRLAELLYGNVPVPVVHFVGECAGQTFAIMEYKSGITLRDYLLDRDRKDMATLMEEAGSILAKIHRFHFERSGFLDENLSISQPIDREGYTAFAKGCLKHPTVRSKIDEAQIGEIGRHFKRFAKFLPGAEECCLVHADYDPANILIDCQNGRWGITAILDWEFAFSGSPLCDVANMLRYSHHMPEAFEEGFLNSLRIAGTELPEGWRISVHLLNLLSLLDCLVRCPPSERPNQCADICDLIGHINQWLVNA